MVEENVGSVGASKKREAPEILTKPLPQILDEIEVAIGAAKTAAGSAERASQRAEEAVMKAEEALRKAEEIGQVSVIGKVLASWEFLTLIGVVFVGAVLAAVAISLGLGLGLVP